MPKAARVNDETGNTTLGQDAALQTGISEPSPHTPNTEDQAGADEETPRTVSEYLKHHFTAEERLKLSEQLSQAVMERSTAEEELQIVKADFKSRITRAETTIADCARKIYTGYEMRNVECELVKDFATNTVRYRRLDTGDFVRERAMTSEERQRTLELVTPPTPQSL